MDREKLKAAIREAYLEEVSAKLATMTEAERVAFMKWFNARPR